MIEYGGKAAVLHAIIILQSEIKTAYFVENTQFAVFVIHRRKKYYMEAKT